MQTIYWPYFWKLHSLLSSGQTWRVFSQREMQWKWNAWLQTPQETVHSSLVAELWFAWNSMQRSMMWFRQMAQLSTIMSEVTKNRHKKRKIIQGYISRGSISFVYKNAYPMPTKLLHFTVEGKKAKYLDLSNSFIY